MYRLLIVGGGLFGSQAAALARLHGIEALVFDPGLGGAASPAAAGLFKEAWAGKKLREHFDRAALSCGTRSADPGSRGCAGPDGATDHAAVGPATVHTRRSGVLAHQQPHLAGDRRPKDGHDPRGVVCASIGGRIVRPKSRALS